ncbi:hypothetical protein GCM10011375_27450 [Hymenobacter qilianensis]|uniref:Uncharacterized protein n=1 Tax=Hymenobacter qilianensis TaxID=1385715 RepID=A0ACB5PTU1_9BACT|nr:hypothetical protein [Hymenobacter qilianensis]GGF70873.1 hypothetical protein GCM10011375_27450 [Hymenobacter qilianensis]
MATDKEIQTALNLLLRYPICSSSLSIQVQLFDGQAGSGIGDGKLQNESPRAAMALRTLLFVRRKAHARWRYVNG